MKINTLTKQEFNDLLYNNTSEFMNLINNAEVFIVKNFYSFDFCQKIRNETFEWGINTTPSWHPFFDDCPDYHREHDNYPKAYVKQKFHGFYRHNYIEKNRILFESFMEVFEIKNYIAGFSKNEFINNRPSEGILPRVNVHHYPRGGGYQSEHIDPNGPFAQIQTLVIASQFGKDYTEGGVYARSGISGVKNYLDPLTEVGDLLVLSPAIPHGVDFINPDEEYQINSNNGRWVFLPLFLFSDYENKENIKPKQV